MPGRVSSVAFDRTGDRFAATSSLDGKGEVRVYDVSSGKKVVLEKVTGPAYAAAWHPRGKVVASAGFDGKVWLHDPATGQAGEGVRRGAVRTGPDSAGAGGLM